ncbi:MAG: hypothetical protein U9R58_06015 [Chloroflexota bacterium]|nr:hypothetical protein [Chloroflexota bacterium]
MSNEQKKQSSFWGSVLRFFGCLVILIIIIATLGAGGYFGVPYLYAQYIQPVQKHALRLDELETRIDQNEQLMSERLDEFANRLESLVVQVDSNKEAIADIESRLTLVEESQAEQTTFNSETAEALAAMQTSVEELSAEQAVLRTDLTITNNDLENLDTRVGEFNSDLEAVSKSVSELSDDVLAINEKIEDQNKILKAVQFEMQMLKAMELLTRGRMFLSEGNITIARADIQQARDLLFEMSSQIPEHQQETLLQIITILDEVLDIMASSPIEATDKLEGAWQLLIEGLPVEPKL